MIDITANSNSIHEANAVLFFSVNGSEVESSLPYDIWHHIFSFLEPVDTTCMLRANTYLYNKLPHDEDYWGLFLEKVFPGFGCPAQTNFLIFKHYVEVRLALKNSLVIERNQAKARVLALTGPNGLVDNAQSNYENSLLRNFQMHMEYELQSNGAERHAFSRHFNKPSLESLRLLDIYEELIEEQDTLAVFDNSENMVSGKLYELNFALIDDELSKRAVLHCDCDKAREVNNCLGRLLQANSEEKNIGFVQGVFNDMKSWWGSW